MATRIKYALEQILGKCNCFYFEDATGAYSSTNRGGFGSPNIEYEDVTKTEIYVTDASGNRYKVDREFFPDKGKILICTSDFVLSPYQAAAQENVDENCGCGNTTPIYIPPLAPCNQVVVQDCKTPRTEFKLNDGCNTIEYYLYGTTNKKRVCDYTITGLNLQSDQKLWIIKNGVLIDATEDIEDGTLEFTQTNDVYTNYYIKKGSRTEICGSFTVSNCTTETMAEEGEYLISYYIKNETFVCHTEYGLSRLTYKTNIGIASCDWNVPGLSQDQANYLIALAWAKLEIIKNDPGCNCTCIRDTLLQINNIINRINSVCP